MFLTLPILTAGLLFSGILPASGDGMEDAFTRPPDSARPLVYWFWMGRNVTREGITGDLEALKDAGFGGATMCNLADVCTPWACPIADSPLPEIVPYSSDAWWGLLHHAAREANRLGLEFGFHNCAGYECNGGPWMPPELSMQQICFSQTPVTGPGELAAALPRPTVDPRAPNNNPVYSDETGKVEKPVIPARETYYQDIAVLALPAEGVVTKEQVIDLSSRMSADGPSFLEPARPRAGGSFTASATRRRGLDPARAVEGDRPGVRQDEPRGRGVPHEPRPRRVEETLRGRDRPRAGFPLVRQLRGRHPQLDAEDARGVSGHAGATT